MPVTVRGTDILFNDNSIQNTAAAVVPTPAAGDIVKGGIPLATYSTSLMYNPTVSEASSMNGTHSGATSYRKFGYYIGSTRISSNYYYIKKSGVVRTRIAGTAAGASNAYQSYYTQTWWRVYKNGVAVGTERYNGGNANWNVWTEDISVSAGDIIQLYMRVGDGGSFPLPGYFQLSVANQSQLDAFELVGDIS